MVSDRRWMFAAGLVFGGALLGPLAAGGILICVIALAAGYDSGMREHGSDNPDGNKDQQKPEQKPDQERKRAADDRYGVAIYNSRGQLVRKFETVDAAADFYQTSREAVYGRLDRGRFGGDFWIRLHPGEKARADVDPQPAEAAEKAPVLTDEKDIIAAAPMKPGCWIRAYRPEDGTIRDFTSISEAMRSTGCGEVARQLSEGYVKDGWRFIVVRSAGSDADLIGKRN